MASFLALFAVSDRANMNSERIPRSLLGLVSAFAKINILTSGDSSRLGVFAYLPRGASIITLLRNFPLSANILYH